jgi:hypothetical protein
MRSFLLNFDVKQPATILIAFLPEIRITAIAPLPEGVASAMMGSLCI